VTIAEFPVPYRIARRRYETHDTVTLTLEPAGQAIAEHRAGQFTMLSAFGVGEVPISISGRPGRTALAHTIRSAGAVTRALCSAAQGTLVGVRGPYGTDWGIPASASASASAGAPASASASASASAPASASVPASASAPAGTGEDLLLVAGGIGLAPLRPALLAALDQRRGYRRVIMLIGARSPAELVFAAEFSDWRDRGAEVEIIVDHGGERWPGHVGVVTQLIGRARLDPARTTALVCGPEVMMRITARALLGAGMTADRIRISLERNMQCGTAECGHCQLGPLLVCPGRPVVSYQRAEPLLAAREL